MSPRTYSHLIYIYCVQLRRLDILAALSIFLWCTYNVHNVFCDLNEVIYLFSSPFLSTFFPTPTSIKNRRRWSFLSPVPSLAKTHPHPPFPLFLLCLLRFLLLPPPPSGDERPTPHPKCKCRPTLPHPPISPPMALHKSVNIRSCDTILGWTQGDFAGNGRKQGNP